MNRRNDNRLCLRTAFSADVEVRTKERTDILHGKMLDVSMFGMFALVKKILPVNSLCNLTITIPARNSSLILKDIEGVVVREGDDGLGIRFTSSMEWYALFNVYSCYGKPGNLKSSTK